MESNERITKSEYKLHRYIRTELVQEIWDD